LHWCENGIVRDFDCVELATDPVFGDYLYCGSNPATDDADCLKKPDPSPPACVVESPELPVEYPLELAIEKIELSPEVVGQPDLPPEMANGETLNETTPSDGSGLVIPSDGMVEPEPQPGKDGCRAGPWSSSAGGWLLIAALALLSLAAGRNREAR